MKQGDQVKIKKGGREYDAVVVTLAQGDQKLVVVLNSGEYVTGPEVVTESKKPADAANK